MRSRRAILEQQQIKRWTTPFVGPKAIEEGEPFVGRDREVQALFASLTSARIVVLFSPSGAGKSSLINAGLVPKLHREGFKVLGKFRTGSEALLPGCKHGIYVGNILHQWNSLLNQRFPIEDLKGMSLAQFAKGVLETTGTDLPVLIFDQFEEIVRGRLDTPDDVRSFFRNLGELLDNRGLWALISMREDFLGAIEPYRDYVPGALNERQRLDFLTHAKAVDAIKEPMESIDSRPVKFDKALVGLLATRLSMVRSSISLELIPGHYVEPMILQVVCKQIWEDLPKDATEITPLMIPDEQQISGALGRFYEGLVSLVSLGNNSSDLSAGRQHFHEDLERLGFKVSDAPDEGNVRRWFEYELIDGVTRRQTQTGPTKTPVDSAILPALVSAYILRTDVRGDATWYELAHDRLVEAIQESNRKWRRKLPLRQELIAETAERWSKATVHKEEYLLRGEQLDNALEFARAAKLSATETSFLEASRRERDLVKVKFSYQALLVSLAIVLVGVIISFWVYQKWKNTELQKSEASRVSSEARQLSLAALVSSDADPQYSLLLGLSAALRTYNFDRSVTPEAKEAINTALDGTSLELLIKGSHEIHFVKFDDCKCRPFQLITWSLDGQVNWWDTITGDLKGKKTTKARLLVGTLGVPFDYAAGDVAESGDDNTVVLLSGSGGLPSIPDRKFFIRAIALSGSGDRVAVAGDSGEAELWQIGGGKTSLVRTLVELQNIGKSRDLYAVAFSDDGKFLATAGRSGVVSVWDGRSGRWLFDLRDSSLNGTKATASNDGTDDSIYQLRFTGDPNFPNENWVAAAGRRGFRIWSTRRDGRDHPDIRVVDNPQVATPLYAIAIDQHIKKTAPPGTVGPVSAHIATAGSDGLIQVWDYNDLLSPDLSTPVQTLRGHTGRVYSLAFNADGSQIASGGADQTARIWTLNYQHFPVGLSAFNVDATRLAVVGTSASASRTGADAGRFLSLWGLDTKELFPEFSCAACSRPVFGDDGTTLAIPSDASFLYNSQIGFPIQRHDRTPFAYGAALDSEGNNVAVLSPKGLSLSTKFKETYIGTIKDVSIRAVSLAPDGSRLAFGCVDGSVHLIQLASGLDGQQPVSCQDDTKFKIDGKPLLIRFCRHKDASHLAVGSTTGTVKVWDLLNPQAPKVYLKASLNNIRDVAFYANPPGGELIAVAAQDGLAVYDLNGGEQLASPGPSIGISALGFDSAGTLMTVDDYGKLRKHQLDGPHLISSALSTLTRTFSPTECQHLQNQGLFNADGCLAGLEGLTQALREARSGGEGKVLTGNGLGKAFYPWYHDRFTPSGEQAVRRLRAEALVERAMASVKLATQNGNMTELAESLTLISEARRLAALEEPLIHPLAETLLSAGQGLAKHAQSDDKIDKIERAITYYHNAEELDPIYFEPSSKSRAVWDLNNLCWFATVSGIQGAAKLVLPLCNQAVALADEVKKPAMRDSRGLALACLGDNSGAKSDFSAVIAWPALGKDDKDKRSRWLKNLSSQPPQGICTPSVLGELRKQYQGGK